MGGGCHDLRGSMYGQRRPDSSYQTSVGEIVHTQDRAPAQDRCHEHCHFLGGSASPQGRIPARHVVGVGTIRAKRRQEGSFQMLFASGRQGIRKSRVQDRYALRVVQRSYKSFEALPQRRGCWRCGVLLQTWNDDTAWSARTAAGLRQGYRFDQTLGAGCG